MASNKSLMENIDKNVSSIKESKFGTKLPSNKNKDKENTEQELAYEQMIMGTLASLTWGIKKLSKPTDIKSYFNHENIFSFVKEIKQYSGGTNVLLKNILDVIKKPNVSSNIKSSDININIANLDDLSKLIDKLSGEQSKMNVIHGVSSIIELYKSMPNVYKSLRPHGIYMGEIIYL